MGDILTTRNATAPSTRWPGTTWRAITTMLLGASDKHPVGSTGGAESVTSGGTAINREQLPDTVLLNYTNDNGGDISVRGVLSQYNNIPDGQSGFSFNQNAKARGLTTEDARQPHTHTVATMPPYTAVYIWERTA